MGLVDDPNDPEGKKLMFDHDAKRKSYRSDGDVSMDANNLPNSNDCSLLTKPFFSYEDKGWGFYVVKWNCDRQVMTLENFVDANVMTIPTHAGWSDKKKFDDIPDNVIFDTDSLNRAKVFTPNCGKQDPDLPVLM